MMRPLPSGRITSNHAIGYGIATGIAATGILAAGTNLLTAGLGLANIALYAGLYTPLKQHTKWNTWVGSLVGAIPPIMGWTAATGTLYAPESILLGSTLFLWQFPHFFSLAWMLRKDYAAGGHQMITAGDPNGIVTAQTIRRYAVYLAAPPVIGAALGLTSQMFAVETVLLNGYWIYQTNQFVNDSSDKNARRIFMTSLWYLPVVLTLMVYHSDRWTDELSEIRKAMTDKCPHEALKSAEKCPHIILAEKGEELLGNSRKVTDVIKGNVDRT
jgi:protoheme IX farnesyltransferase